MEIDYQALEDLWDAQLRDPAFSGLSKKYVPGEGDNPTAIIIGEAPGAQEDMQGRPFVGPAGQVLRQLMDLAWLATSYEVRGTADNPNEYGPNCWLTNTIKFRPPGNRKPTLDEIAAARQYLVREWQAIGKPRVVVLVGAVALHAITGKEQSILRAAGKMYTAISKTDGQPLFVWPMVHPSFALRNPGVQPVVEQDWERLGAWLAENS